MTKHFVRHYVEMAIAMYAGMALLIPFEITAPGATFGMVAWMRYRGHGWRPCAEMSASMIVPTVAAIGLLATGVVTDHGTLMTLEHLAMFPLMLVAMLARPAEYSCHGKRGAVAA
jgi:hypothetical protein